MELVKLARALIDIPSVTGAEGPIADFLTSTLESLGFRILSQPIQQDRRNLLATLGEPPRLIFCTHMDTVPPFSASAEDDDYIYGRGSCDAKGILASMIIAGEAIKKAGISSFGLLFVIGEETDSIGAKRAPEISPGPDYIIVGEPTQNRLGSAHKGVFTVRLAVKGRSGHSAYPEHGVSAVNALLDVLEVLRRTDFGEDALLGKTTLNIGLISGGTAPNVIPESADATLSLRIVRPPSEVLSLLRSICGPGIDIEVLSESPPQKLHTVPGFDPVVLPFGTDIPYLSGYGKPLLIGPGSVLDAHKDRERVKKAELFEAVHIYKALAERLLYGKSQSPPSPRDGEGGNP